MAYLHAIRDTYLIRLPRLSSGDTYLSRLPRFWPWLLTGQVTAQQLPDPSNKALIAQRTAGALRLSYRLDQGGIVVLPEELVPGAHPPGRLLGQPGTLRQRIALAAHMPAGR